MTCSGMYVRGPHILYVLTCSNSSTLFDFGMILERLRSATAAVPGEKKRDVSEEEGWVINSALLILRCPLSNGQASLAETG